MQLLTWLAVTDSWEQLPRLFAELLFKWLSMFNVIRFPLIFLSDKIIKLPLFVSIKAFVFISIVNEKMLYGIEKVSVANQQALIGAQAD